MNEKGLMIVEQLRRMLAVLTPPRRGEEGDVPGWVMVTLMTAGFVAAITAVAGPRLQSMVSQALQSVGG